MRRLILSLTVAMLIFLAIPIAMTQADGYNKSNHDGSGNSGNDKSNHDGGGGNNNTDNKNDGTTDNNQTSTAKITGKVTTNGIPVNGAKVTVVCNGNTENATTNRKGSYSVNFNGKCSNGDNVTVTAVDGSLSGSNSGTVKNGSCSSDVTIINVSVPEFGLITGITALTLGGGSFLFTRRRILSSK